MSSMGDDCNMLDPQAFWSAVVLRRLTLTEGVSPRDRIGTVANTQQALENELSAIRVAMCFIRTRRNALSAISALPAEVLIRIFKCCAAMHRSKLSHQRLLGWIEVTHVCRRWRDTALQFPGLWSDICFTLGPRCVEAMLARSAATPISMSFFCPALERSSSFLSLIFEHLHHTRDLQVMGTETADVRPFVYGLPSPSAVLEGLDISLIHTPGEEEGDNFELPGVITGSRLPSLRRVTLDGFWMPWSAPILGGLTHLHIQLHKPRRHALDGYLNASHEELFSVLKTLRALESLILINCLPSGHWADRNDEVLRLPQLEMLQLQGPSAACFGLAKRLRIRPRCQVQLRCTDDTDVTEILPFLSALTSGGADLSPWHTLLLTHDIDTGFRLQMWRLCNAPRTDDESEDEFDLEPLDVDLAISSCSPGQSYGPLQRLCRVLPLETIRTIHVSIDTFGHNVPARDWINMLGECSETTRVWIRNGQAISFCEALGMNMDHHPRPLAELDPYVRMSRVPFLWNLETLKLSNVDLGMRGYDMRGYNIAFYTLLVDWLADRHNANMSPSLKIELADCEVRKEWVKDLEEVARVKWDNNDGSCNSWSEGEGEGGYSDD